MIVKLTWATYVEERKSEEPSYTYEIFVRIYSMVEICGGFRIQPSSDDQEKVVTR